MSETTDEFDSLTEFRAQFDWSPELTPKMVADSHKGQFPVISVVTSGYDGCDGMHEFALDEVYCIVSILKQKRVVVTDMNHRFISIPLDYHAKFHSLSTDGKIKGPVKTLSQIIDSDGRGGGGGCIRLMFEDNQAVKFNECASIGSKDKLGYLEYDESYNEKYLVCHPLQNSEILGEVVLIPIYVPISMAIVRGFSPTIIGDFNNWMASIRGSVKAFDTTNIKPCMDIVVFEDSPASDYVTIMPVSLFQHTKNNNDSEANPSLKETITYDNITQCRERKKRGPCPLPPQRKDRCSVLIEIPERSLPSTKTSPRLPPKSDRTPANSPPSPKEGGRQKTPQQSPVMTSSSRETKPPPLPPRGIDSSAGAPRQSKSSTSQRLKVTASSPASKESQDPCDVFKELPSSPPPPPHHHHPPPPPPPSSLILCEERPSKMSPTGNATRFVKGVEVEEHRHQTTAAAPPPPPPSSSKTSKKVSTAQDLVIKQFQSRKVAPQPPVAMEILKETKPTTGGGGDEDQETNVTPYEDVSQQQTKRQWKRAAEIPLDLDIGSLTVVELCHCLSLLKMDKYSQMFLDQMVDGALLVELTDQMLCQQFGFSVFEVKKLMNFVKNGWRPKTE